ncbi:MAG TPA: T9SS type A sorting domain-containing protein [Chitinophagales bacterium]|nr:T9SS type A sorting domain-containing protein [Chitinophagales bacterium]
MKKLFLGSLFSAIMFCGNAAVVDSLYYLFSLTKTQLDSTLEANGVPSAFVGTIYDIDVYKVRYFTPSLDSSTIYATGLLTIPTNTSCRLPLASFGHGTTSDREGVPSRANGGEAMISMVFGSLGYISTAPDYIGLGDAPAGLLHPYQDARTEASATIDLLRAARELGPQLNYRLNGQVFLSGYSQGGHTAMATHMMMQSQLPNEFTVTASVPMSGAYDLSGVMVDVMLSDSDYAVPGYLPYLVFSWNQRYNFYSSPSEYLRSPYDVTLPPLFDGTHGMGEINAAMPSVPKLIFKQEMIDSFTNNLNHPFRLALKDNDVYDWKPECPVQIVFCRADEEVNPRNAVVLYDSFKDKGATNFDTICASETLPHFQCAQFAVLAMKSFVTPFQQVDSCAAVGINDINESQFSIYPNPANDKLNIGFKEEFNLQQVTAVNGVGQRIELPFTSSGYQTNVSVQNLAGGLYLLKAVSNGKEVTVGRFMKVE